MTTELKSVKVGDYYETSWGYDQTNIDFLVVVSISLTGKTALCRMARGVRRESLATQDGLTPGRPYGPEFKMHIRQDRWYGEAWLRGSYPYISGRSDKRLGSFYPTEVGKVAYKTKPEFGH